MQLSDLSLPSLLLGLFERDFHQFAGQVDGQGNHSDGADHHHAKLDKISTQRVPEQHMGGFEGMCQWIEGGFGTTKGRGIVRYNYI